MNSFFPCGRRQRVRYPDANWRFPTGQWQQRWPATRFRTRGLHADTPRRANRFAIASYNQSRY